MSASEWNCATCQSRSAQDGSRDLEQLPRSIVPLVQPYGEVQFWLQYSCALLLTTVSETEERKRTSESFAIYSMQELNKRFVTNGAA